MLAGLLLLGGRVGAAEIHSPAGLSARVDEPTGAYELVATNFDWHFAGSLGGAVKNATVNHGQDSLGAYEEISLAWNDGLLPMSGRIRLYDAKPLARFFDRCGAATEMPPSPFPSFTHLPANLHRFSYRQDTFAPPQFAANDCSTPWLLFDDQADALVISPASHLMVASLLGDGERTMASGFNPQLRNLPAGFEQQTLMAFGRGINQTWDAWGRTLTGLEGATRPGNDADRVLKYFGYWTDNGAFYYYNYDLDLGYAGTLAALGRTLPARAPSHSLPATGQLVVFQNLDQSGRGNRETENHRDCRRANGTATAACWNTRRTRFSLPTGLTVSSERWPCPW